MTHWEHMLVAGGVITESGTERPVQVVSPGNFAAGAITPEEFEELSEEELTRLVPRQYRDYFPGKDACGDGFFYLHDGTAWSFYKGGFLDD